MKKVVLLLIGLLFLSCPASAYQIYINAPDSLAIGKPLVVTGTTTLGIGTPIDVVLYYQLTTTSEIERIGPVYVQSDKSFEAIFETTSLKPGAYKVEVPSPASGDSVTMRLVNLFDRTDDILISSPLNQSFTGKIYLTGEIKGLENSGVQVDVIDPDGLVIFGPQYINTDNAARFAAVIPIPSPGAYEVSFTDANGYIGSRTIYSASQTPEVQPDSSTSTLKAQPVMTTAHTRSSRDAPAYFIVKSGTGPVTIYTSKSLDWVVEYIDEKGILYMKNDQGDQKSENVQYRGTGKTVYFKIYPYKYSVTGDLFLYGENVNSIIVSETVPAPFTVSGQQTSATQKSPFFPLVATIAVFIAMGISGKKGN